MSLQPVGHLSFGESPWTPRASDRKVHTQPHTGGGAGGVPSPTPQAEALPDCGFLLCTKSLPQPPGGVRAAWPSLLLGVSGEEHPPCCLEGP